MDINTDQEYLSTYSNSWVDDETYSKQHTLSWKCVLDLYLVQDEISYDLLVKKESDSIENGMNESNEIKYELSQQQFMSKQRLESQMDVHIEDFNTYREQYDIKEESTELKTNICHICSKLFSQPESLAEHHYLVHNICEICGRRFVNSDGLRTHFTVHSTDKVSYKCSVCNKLCTCLSHMIIHSRTHSRTHSEKLFKCERCGKGFSEEGNFKEHKCVSCEVCNKFFNCLSDLIIHRRVHSGEKPYKCEICNKAFSRSYHLKTHSKVHSSEKPYKCKKCGKDFKQKRSLKAHTLHHSL